MGQGSTARRPVGQQIAYHQKNVNFNTAGIATGVKLGTLPKGAKIFANVTTIETAFNSAGTNRLVIGTNSTSYNNIATSTVNAAGTAGSKQSLIGGTLDFTQDTDVYIKYTAATGTAATTGNATVILAFTVDNQGS